MGRSSLDLNNQRAREAWAEYTAANVGKQVGITLDGKVISAPTIQGAITGGRPRSRAASTRTTATELANQLKYGALPLSFTQATAQSISTELGAEQLQAGLIAGAIGIALVFVYALVYYRLLGLVMIASLVLSAVVVYACLVLLGRQIGFTLSLAGIAGFIVAIGITADSFVVYFERLKDEIREGRSLRSAVPRAWVRARRTILSADAVSFLAAAILYMLAIGDVKGFAFTLGMSTVLDLVVVFLFTHPLMAVLARFKSFGSSRMSGLGRVEHTRRPGGSATRGPRTRGCRQRRRHGQEQLMTRPDTPADDEAIPVGTDADEQQDADAVLAESSASADEDALADAGLPREGTRPGEAVRRLRAPRLPGAPALQRRGRARRRRPQPADLQDHRRGRAAVPRCR